MMKDNKDFLRAQANERQRFSIRKLTVGAASVLLGTCFFLGGQNNIAKADTVPTTTQEAPATDIDKENAEKTKEAVDQVRNDLGDKGTVDENNAQTIDRVIHYQEKGTSKPLSGDKEQDISIVPYYKNGHLKITYHDDTDNKDIDKSETITHYVGTKIKDDEINGEIDSKTLALENKGYDFSSTDLKGLDDSHKFTEKDQNIVVHFTHGIKTDTETKEGTQTVHYEGAGDQTPEDVTDKITFTRTNTTDKVTNDITYGSWDANSKTYPKIPTPSIPGYTANISEVGGDTITATDKELNRKYIVTYTKNQETPVVNDQKAQVRYLDQDQNNKEITKSDILIGKAGSTIQYSTAKTIEDLENKGYELVSDDFKNAKFDSDDATTQTYNVILKHKTITINPKNPGKPGEPINPKDPNGVKWPEGTDKDSLIKTGTQTVHYEGAGDKTPNDNVTKVEFEHSITYDRVTGKVVKDNGWTPESKSYSVINTPNVEGYTADEKTAGGNTVKVTDSNINREYTVHYTKDPETPKTVQGKVTYIDDTTGNILDTATFKGNVGDKIDYTTTSKISGYESGGYELVSNNFKDGNEVFSKNGNNFEVHLKHSTQPVNPQNPGGSFNPNDPSSPAMLFASFIQLRSTDDEDQPTVYYAIVDNKKKQIIAKGLSEKEAKSKLAEVISPNIPGYRLVDEDQKMIDDLFVNRHSNKHTDITVLYEKIVTPHQPNGNEENPTDDHSNEQPKTKDPEKTDKDQSKKNETPKTSQPSKTETKKTTKNKKKSTKKSKKRKTTKSKISKTTSTRRSKKRKPIKHWSENNRTLAQKVDRQNKKRTISNNSPLSQTKAKSASISLSANKAELPQTGEKQNNLGLIGLAFASIAGLFGIAADRKRKN